ncbi:MAG: hypothetical protein GF344_05355, partial [Chitinivibrionales bacterium]|nr:hypothetical protein [Chitinivibrionales bacterium]
MHVASYVFATMKLTTTYTTRPVLSYTSLFPFRCFRELSERATKGENTCIIPAEGNTPLKAASKRACKKVRLERNFCPKRIKKEFDQEGQAWAEIEATAAIDIHLHSFGDNGELRITYEDQTTDIIPLAEDGTGHLRGAQVLRLHEDKCVSEIEVWIDDDDDPEFTYAGSYNGSVGCVTAGERIVVAISCTVDEMKNPEPGED